MARDSQRLEQEFIQKARENTGHDVPEWMSIMGESDLTKQTALVKWLKEQHGLNHLQATFLTGIYLNNGQPVFDYPAMFEKLFAGKDHLKPVYHALEEAIQTEFAGEDVALIPTKAYVSIEGTRIFACVTLMKSSIRVGLDLGDRPFDATVQQAKGLGAMPNLSHMVEISTPDDITPEVVGLLRQAYDCAHRK